jgi:hypothetical protein
MCTFAAEGCAYSASQQLNQGIDVFLRFFTLPVWRCMSFLSHDWFMSTERSSTVSEHKKLTMFVVCNLIHTVHTTIPHPASSFHIGFGRHFSIYAELLY